MAILKAKYTNQDDIPEGVRDLGLYEERDGEWLLKRDAIEGVKTAADVERINEVARKERDARNEAEKKLKRYDRLGDADPEELLKLSDEVVELRAQVESGAGGKNEEAIQRRIEAAVAREVNPLRRELDKHKGEAETYRTQAEQLSGQIRKSSLEAELNKHASKAKVRPESVPDILRYQDVFEQDEVTKKWVTKDGVGMTPGLDMETWFDERKSDRAWWPESTGGGARGSNGNTAIAGNPFTKGAGNLTRASELMTNDPAKADQYAKAAGYASAEAAAIEMASQVK